MKVFLTKGGLRKNMNQKCIVHGCQKKASINLGLFANIKLCYCESHSWVAERFIRQYVGATGWRDKEIQNGFLARWYKFLKKIKQNGTI